MKTSGAAMKRAHPRLRGADHRAIKTSLPALGSSPLTRGGPDASKVAESNNGLIPAYAGRTPWQVVACCRGEAHPRLRGADVLLMLLLLARWGSSPLTRGGLPLIRLAKCRGWLIPAYAGRTSHPADR